MGKYRVTFDVKLTELEKTNLAPAIDKETERTISIDISAKYGYEAVAKLEGAIQNLIDGKPYIHYPFNDKFIVGNKHVSPIENPAQEEDID